MKKAFTLIEIMIVVAIIAFALGISMARYSSVRRRAIIARVQSDQRNLNLAIQLFHASKGYYPILGTDIATGDDNLKFSKAFLKFYSKDKLPEVPEIRGLSSDIIERSKIVTWEDKNYDGGWIYNEETGELYPNLPDDIYNQGVEWVPDEPLQPN